MAEDSKQDYLTLFEAAKLCPYSEAYLRLRARQGKLKSIKIGKKWMTTKDWVNDYVIRAQEWNEKTAAKRIKKDLIIPKPEVECSMPNIVALPAGSYALPQIEFAPVAQLPAVSVPQAPKTINYGNPQFLFVLGSSVLVALLLFVWMTADFKAGSGTGIQPGQASLSGSVQQNAAAPKQDGLEAQMNPQTLEQSLGQESDQSNAAVDQLQIVTPPKTDSSLIERIHEKLFGGGR